ncbi:sodium-dependent transporter [Anoxynatronum buryatiense]|uniref:Neurotransmitter:Na+ symporter, NSS family n=1 Tax=Anoxynatronum buryatiense TaxID=489973 RepID=A0AA45WVR5_9CLOT|nr:sodium-dependent transporter [Anoxynatronum buryatiense]SMP54961.1 neurotransmitter:Na+ symporter, NSS family [Anoxynatronum buryatiense]
MNQSRENWGSRMGFIMAAAGSAVGLGNIWRFPYMAGANGGSAFILIYLVFVFIIGLSVMIAEFAVGRRTSLAAVGAYKHYSKRWTFAGVLGVVSAFFIMGFYPVVGGWALAYVFKSLTGLLSNAGAIGDTFGAFITNPMEPLVWMIIFLLMNVVIVAKGISGGIEKAGKVLMPTLFVLLILIAVRSVTLPGASAGLAFLFQPDFSEVTGQTFLAALGQAFFSLSLGMGCMITYGSYLSKEEKLPNNALIVTALDTGVALLAGIAIFPALFAFGMEPAAGPGLVFVVVPSIFAQMGGIGTLFAAIFFVALTVAALTSSVSLMEVVAAYLIDQKQMDRKKAVYSTGFIMVITGILSSLSLGVMSGFTILGVGVFDFFDILTDKIFLAIGGMLLAIFVGWVVKKEDLRDELTNGGAVPFGLFDIWYNVVKYVIPLAVAVVAVLGILDIAQTGLMLFGLAVILVLGIFSHKL